MKKNIILSALLFISILLLLIFIFKQKSIKKFDEIKKEKEWYTSKLLYSFSCIPKKYTFLKQQYGTTIIYCKLSRVTFLDSYKEEELQDSLLNHKFLKFIVDKDKNHISFLLGGFTKNNLEKIDSIEIESINNTITLYTKGRIAKTHYLSENLYWEIYNLNKIDAITSL